MSSPTFSSSSSSPHHNIIKKQSTFRQRTFNERQPYLFAYGLGISIFAPFASAWQLCKLYKIPIHYPQLAGFAGQILVHQTLLKMAQMNAMTPIKENLNLWAAFAVGGVLQGGVYGQSITHLSKKLNVGSNVSLKGMFRGSAFGAGRDVISQGVPYVFSRSFERAVIDPVLQMVVPSKVMEDPSFAEAKGTCSVIPVSIGATYGSQALHNCQIKMQSDQSLSYVAATRAVWAEHGSRIFWTGAPARVGLLLVVNILNALVLRRAWELVEEPGVEAPTAKPKFRRVGTSGIRFDDE